MPGLRRDGQGLNKGLEELKRQLPIFHSVLTKREEFEFANLLTCALLTSEAALYVKRAAVHITGRISRSGMIWYGVKHTVLHREERRSRGANSIMAKKYAGRGWR